MSIAVSQAAQGHQGNHQVLTPAQRLASVNEETWLQVGKVAEMMNDLDRAMAAYESALRQNPYSIPAMNQIATILRAREQFPRAVEYFQSILNLDQNNGETWGSLGHCYLMMDDLQKAYSAYQQALYHLQNPKEPKLWYGIGILYDRYGSLEHAEEAFSQVMRMDSTFDKANEIYFRLGIIYKQQHKYSQSLECFNYIITNPPKPLTEVDIWFQIGHVFEQQKEYGKAKEAYERVLRDNPDHAKVLQQLGWLYHQQSNETADQDLAVQYLTKSLESDGADAQSWYLLGRCYMAQRKYNKAYEAYQQAVYRDGRNPTFWCSIGVLYYQINQYRDALDAYSRAIRLNPYISEVWYDLGTLYESCNNQVSDALDAYSRAAELDPSNPHIKLRLELLRSGQSTGARPNQAGGPHPQDINPNAYQNGPQGPPQQGWGSAPPQHNQPAQPNQQHRRPTTPAQAPFRPAELQSMRPPQSPDRSKIHNGGGSNRPPIAKGEQTTHYSPHQGQNQSHSQHQAQHQTNYPPQPNPMGSHGGPMNQHSSHAQAPSTPSAGASLAPMLGRTSPVSEIKPFASRDDANAPREQPSSNTTPSGNHNRHPSPTLSAKDNNEAVTLKRPREWEDGSSAPDAKKQELSKNSQDGNNSRSTERTERARSERRSVEAPSVEQQSERAVGDTSESNSAAEQINGRWVENGNKSSTESKDDEGSRPSSQPPKETVTEDLARPASGADQTEPEKKEASKEPEPNPAPETAERKVELDENYDDEE